MCDISVLPMLSRRRPRCGHCGANVPERFVAQSLRLPSCPHACIDASLMRVQVLAQAAQDTAHSTQHSTIHCASVLGGAPDPEQLATDRRLAARERIALEQRNIILPAQCAAMR